MPHLIGVIPLPRCSVQLLLNRIGVLDHQLAQTLEFFRQLIDFCRIATDEHLSPSHR